MEFKPTPIVPFTKVGGTWRSCCMGRALLLLLLLLVLLPPREFLLLLELRLPPPVLEAGVAAPPFPACGPLLHLPFAQSMHLQISEQLTPAWKHSQYFFRHWDFLQWQPLRCLDVLRSTIPLLLPLKNACGSLSNVAWIALLRAASCSGSPSLLQQVQLQPRQYP